MPNAATNEAHTAAAETRALWREYRECSRMIANRCDGPLAEHYANDEDVSGSIVRLLREQRRILDELLGREP